MKNILEYFGQGLLFLLLVIVIAGAYLYAPLAQGLGEYTRVMYFHVPVAWVTVLAFLISAGASFLYLRKKELIYDLYAESANQLGILFCVLATVTGAMWAKASWGAYWNWDPRQTSIFILLLIYAAYFALRTAIEDEKVRARLSAVYSILAFVTVPFFIFIVPRIYESLHPDPLLNQEAKLKMDSKMFIVFMISLVSFTLMFLWLFIAKNKINKLNLKLEEAEN